MVTKKVHLQDAQEALLLFGQHDQNLRALENSYGVQIFGRGQIFSVRGAPGKVEKTLLAIDEMRQNLAGENRTGSDDRLPKGSDSVLTEASDATFTTALGKS